MPDTSTSNNCTGWVLYTERDGNLLPVQYASAKLKSYMGSWYPCEAEAAGVALAVEQVRHWINESKYPTKVLPDSKPVVDCANLMKRGKASKNARLQSLLNCINRSNIVFYHSSDYSKLFEAFLKEWILEDIEDKLDPSQFGGRSSSGTETFDCGIH